MIYDIIIYTIAYDIWFYISHILLHKNNLFKFIHKEHHKTNYKTMIYSDTYVAHILESPFQFVGIFIPIFLMKFHIYNFLYSILFLNIRGMLRHDNRFTWLVGNHHILHHTYPQYNYGEYWLDYIFDTNYKNKDECIKGLIGI
jgi:lathosterol oxidase